MLQQNIPHLNLLTRICQVANFRLVCVQVPLPITPDFVGIDCRLVRRPLLATMWCEAPMFTMIFGWVGSCIDNIRFCIECCCRKSKSNLQGYETFHSKGGICPCPMGFGGRPNMLQEHSSAPPNLVSTSRPVTPSWTTPHHKSPLDESRSALLDHPSPVSHDNLGQYT